MKPRHAACLLLLLAACGRGDRPVAAPAEQAAAAPLGPWTWHPLGGLAVVEGEVSEPTELILESRSFREKRFAELGPVRWEFFRPPEGEVGILRTAEGRELARFDFSLPKPAPKAAAAPRLARRAEPPPPAPIPRPALPQAQARLRPAPPPKPQVEARPAPPAAKPLPEPPAPRTQATARMQPLPTQPLAPRKTAAMPRLAEVPAQAPSRALPIAPLQAEAESPRPLKPLPAGSSLGPWPGMGEALNLTKGPGGQKRILLSFDGGSNAEVAAEVLDLLKARGLRTTLFLTGAFIQKFPALVKRMAAEGHELGNHTMNHPHFAPDMKRDPKWTRERVQRELLEADAALLRLIGRPMDPYWRAPYGEHTAEIRRWAEELGYRHVGWSEGADTLDWATPKDRRLYRSGEAIVKRLEGRLDRNGDGLIVLMHLGSERAPGDRPTDGLGAFMDRARREGWTFVCVSAFLRDLGKPSWDPQQRLALLNGAQEPGR